MIKEILYPVGGLMIAWLVVRAGLRSAGYYSPWSRRMRRALRELHECDPEYEQHLRDRFWHETNIANATRDGAAFCAIRARALADAETHLAVLKERCT